MICVLSFCLFDAFGVTKTTKPRPWNILRSARRRWRNPTTQCQPRYSPGLLPPSGDLLINDVNRGWGQCMHFFLFFFRHELSQWIPKPTLYYPFHSFSCCKISFFMVCLVLTYNLMSFLFLYAIYETVCTPLLWLHLRIFGDISPSLSLSLLFSLHKVST